MPRMRRANEEKQKQQPPAEPTSRCTHPNCGSNTTRRRNDRAHTRDVTAFHSYVTGTANLNDIANTMNISRRTLDRRFAKLLAHRRPQHPRSPPHLRPNLHLATPTHPQVSSSSPPASTMSLLDTGPTRNHPRLHTITQ
ncbi:hypothetical protein UL82_02720 [Corynebacterium kutscheri]|uniref:Transposase for insertion sequence element n=1 Tax=Corynebacterium kutscheri TaxID=35755 RepID=A0A0F6R117_9CORY|nr:hypothetical protein UL82_02720 [Corynebacterium kutscheri]VEH04538.1 transposase for insertion sequence element [Corynebacterium kutscheri]VEH11166.1 transposase for insertion sequence element [Corynebacterium kutscheri]